MDRSNLAVTIKQRVQTRTAVIEDEPNGGKIELEGLKLGSHHMNDLLNALDEDEAMRIAALAATLDPKYFQHYEQAAHGVLRDDVVHTRIVDGACIFLNRPGFAGGAGCALHGQAMRDGESPLDWKPSVCWQLPLRVDRSIDEDGTAVATLRRWSRADWGPDGQTMAWCCTEGDKAYVGSTPVIESLADELQALMGDDVVVEIKRQLGEAAG